MGIPAPQIPDAPTQPIATPKGARKPAPLLLAGIIPFAALLIYSLVPVAPRSVNLREVVTTHAEMTVAPSGGGAQLVTESIDARSVLVDGATGVYVPATVDGAGRQLATDLVYLEAAEGGTVTVNGLRIEPGGIIAVEPGSAPGEVRLVLRELTDLTLSVSGPVDVLTGDDALGTLDFGASGAVNVTPGSLMSLEIALADSIRGVSCGTCSPFRLLSDVEVQQLRLSRVEQDVSLERTAAERISTIRSGRVEVGDRTLSLEEGDDVRFDGYPGTVRSLDVSDAPYTLDADADLAPNATVDGTSVQPIRFGTMRLPFQVALALMIVIQALAYVVLRRRNA